MSTLETHEAEQAEITAACEAGTCDHPYCGLDFAEIAGQIMEDDEAQDTNERRAARALLAFMPSYEDTPQASIRDFLIDLMHLCDLAGWDFAEIEDDARRLYQREIGDLGPASDPAFARAIKEG